MTSNIDFILRPAAPADVPAIVGLIHELAAFEHLAHLARATPDTLLPHLFGPRPVVEAWVAQVPAGDAAEVVGFALFFTNFSTFLSQPGIHLEDLYVKPAYRNLGIGRALLTRVAQITVERGQGRFDWTVLDWNESAIGFYEKLGAVVMPDWRTCRLSGEALSSLASSRNRAGFSQI